MAGNNFFEENFDIHGKFQGKVYRTKRNGKQEIYDYEPVSHYKRTALTIRNEQIRKLASTITNPHEPDYKQIISKMNYYTPYILNAGISEFLAGTVFYVREKGSFEFIWQDSEMGNIQKIGKRSKLSFNFRLIGTKQLNVFHNDELYCQRVFVITENTDLDSEYQEWLSEHLEEILALPEPEYESVKIYRRGLRSKSAYIEKVTGKAGKEVLSTRKDLDYKDIKTRPWIYHRRVYDHSDNPQSQEFNGRMAEIGAAWKALPQEERDFWNDKARKTKKRLTGFNLFTGKRMKET